MHIFLHVDSSFFMEINFLNEKYTSKGQGIFPFLEHFSYTEWFFDIGSLL